MCSISTLIRSCLLLAACAFLGPQIGAQTLLDSFDDGFDPTLGWQGDLLAFNGEGGRLVLREQRPVPASSARVWVPAATRDSACWMLNIDQRFSASTSNRVRWWLAADRALTQAGLQGHYFQFGGISGNDDALELFAVSGGTTTLVAGGRAGLGAADPLELQVQVCAHADQSWTWRATNNAGAVLDSARGSSPRALNGTFAGLEVAFTSTRVGLLSFDDFQVAPVFRDVQAPQLVLAKAESIRSVLVLANEPLSAANADTALYTVNGRRPARCGSTRRYCPVDARRGFAHWPQSRHRSLIDRFGRQHLTRLACTVRLPGAAPAAALRVAHHRNHGPTPAR